jgi:transposase
LWQKRLEREVFKWPTSREQVMEVSVRELRWLLEGLDFRTMKAHRQLGYSTVV